MHECNDGDYFDQRKPRGRVYFLWLPRHDAVIIKAFKRGGHGSIVELARNFGVTTGAMRRRIFKMRQQGKLGYISMPGSTGRYERH